jgi:hypothetical protein
MKAATILIVFSILAFTFTTYAQEKTATRAKKITLRKACEHRGMVMAIYHQIDPRNLLQNDRHGYYTATVYFSRNTYVIYGKYEEWSAFFQRRPWEAKNKSILRKSKQSR